MEIKLYKDSKELPFYNYKKIIQGDFFYMIKGYDGEDVETDPKELELKFNELIQNFVIATSEKSEEISNHSNYVISTLEYNKIAVAIDVIDFIILSKKALQLFGIDESEEDNIIITDLLEGIKVARDSDIEKLRTNLIQKQMFHENNIAKYEEYLNQNSNNTDHEENDLDKQFINVCLGLEIPFPDENKLTLYQFSLMVDRVLEKMKALDKLNKK